MTNEAIGHRGESSLRRFIRMFESAVARHARIRGVEVLANVARWGQVGFVINCAGDQGRDISKFIVQLVIELRNHRGAGRLDRSIDGTSFAAFDMARRADRRRRQIVVGCFRASSSRRVTRHAGQLLRKMNSMREGSSKSRK